MRKLRHLAEKIVSSLPENRKAQFLEFALANIAEVSYFRLAKQGFRPNGIIDIGAYEGQWTRLVAKIFPLAPILMIEAQVEKKNFLESVRDELPLVAYNISLLGKEEGSEAIFNVMETGSSIYSERSNAPRTQRSLTIYTLDSVLEENSRLREPFFIKLDVQGAELDVLLGGSRALNMAEVVQLEVALLPYNEGAPVANDVFNFMADLGFLIFDICGFVRQKPSNLVQIDVLFVRKELRLRRDFVVF